MPHRGRQAMWRLLPALAVLMATAAQAKPATIQVGPAHTPSVDYGPADMLCDLNTCRLFNLPKETGLPPNAIVQFGLPQLDGQDRVDLRRCFQICRASVIGYAAPQKAPQGPENPTVSIIPIEMRLE
jgi:hypothetical protein